MPKFLRLFVFVCFLSVSASAQKKCEWSTNVSDSLGTYKALKESIVYENKFGNSASYIFMSLQINNGVPYLNFKFMKRSKDFIPAECFDKTSRLYLQLDNGKVVTLIHTDSDDCGKSFYNEGYNTMLSDANFLFVKGSVEDLKASLVSMIRVRYATTVKDYPVVSELKSELTSETYKPQQFFIDYLDCLFN